MKNSILTGLITLLLCSSAAALDRFDLITTEQLNSMLRQRSERKTDFLLINSLDKLIADYHSIPGSINIPWSQISTSVELLGQDRKTPIITYCMGYR